MKRLSYHIFLAFYVLLVTGCITEEARLPEPENPEAGCVIDFRVANAEENTLYTRGVPVGDKDIENLYVLVFDQNGNFLSRTQAVRKSVGGPGSYQVSLTPTDQTLPADKKKRIVHFIANYDWSGFADTPNFGKHENEIVAPLSVFGKRVAYWQRIELPGGIVENAFSAPIELLRNMAKISVNDDSVGGPSTNPYLMDAYFAIGDYLDHGTVAPFDTSAMAFGEGSVVESPSGTLVGVRESDFMEAGSGAYWRDPVYCYERKNSTSHTPSYVIVKGKYSATGEYTYYKIDIVGNGQETLYDIVRNCHYKIKITTITGPGSETLAEAVNSPASNNLLYSIVLEDYTSISDGVAVLNVETTVKTFVETGKEFQISFSYLPDGVVENNTSVDVVLEQSSVESEKVLSSMQVVKTAGDARIIGITAGNIPVYTINSARLIVTAVTNGVTLRRVIKLSLQTPWKFGNFRISPNPAPAAVGSEVNISFTIPNTIRSQHYPLAVYVTAKNLTPNLDSGKDDGLSLDYQIPGRYRYEYIVNYPGDHTIHFKTSLSRFSEIVIVESELFEKVETVVSGGA